MLAKPMLLPDWFPLGIKAFPNKYPLCRTEGDAICDDGTLNIRGEGLWQSIQATGAHEVIIEGPNHFLQFHEFSPDRASLVIAAACMRYHDLRKDQRMRMVD